MSGRLFSKSDSFSLDNLRDPQLLDDLVQVAVLLQGQPFSEELGIARTILFKFLFELLNSQFFENPVTVGPFLRFLYEPEMSSHIISRILASCDKSANWFLVMNFLNSCFTEASTSPDSPAHGKLALDLLQMLSMLMRLNRRIPSQVSICFAAMLKCMRVFHSYEMLLQLLDVLALSEGKVMARDCLILLSTLVRERWVDDRLVFNKLTDLLVIGPVLAPNAMRLIGRPELLPFLLSVYGGSSYATALLQYLFNMSIHSVYNLHRLHEGNLDFILVNFLLPRNEPLFYDGLSIFLDFDRKVRDTLIMPLLESIVIYMSSYAVASLLIKAVLTGDSAIVDFLLRTNETACKLPQAIARLGTVSKPCKITGFQGNLFRGSFTLSFSLILDELASFNTWPTITILKMCDSLGRSLEIISRDNCISMNYQSESMTLSVPLTLERVRAEWADCAITINMDKNPPVMKAYWNGMLARNVGIVALEFEGDMSLMFGNKLDNVRVNGIYGLIGNFRLFPFVLNEFAVKSLCSGFVPDRAVSLSYSQELPLQTSLSKILSDHSLIELLMRYGCGKLDIPILLSLLWRLSPTSVNRDFLMNIVRGTSVSAGLYFCVYSLYERVGKPIEWIDPLLFNLNVWFRCDDNSLQQVLSHWNGVVVPACIDYLQAHAYFERFLSLFERFFSLIVPLDDRARVLYVLLLKSLAYRHLTNLGARMLLFLASSATSVSSAVTYLEVLCDLASMIDRTTTECFVRNLLTLSLRLKHPQITNLVLIVVYELPCENCSLCLWPLIETLADVTAFFDLIVLSLPRYPGIADIACLLALDTGKRVGPSLISLLDIPSVRFMVTKSRFWFLPPILLCLQTHEEIEVIYLIQFLAFLSHDSVAFVSIIFYLFVYLRPFLDSLSFDFLGLFLTQVRVFVKSEEVLKILGRLSLWALAFQRSAPSTNEALLSDWLNSPFAEESFMPVPSRQFPSYKIRNFVQWNLFLQMPRIFDVTCGLLRRADGSFVHTLVINLLQSWIVDYPDANDSALIRFFTMRKELPDLLPDLEERIESTKKEFITQMQAEVTKIFNEFPSLLDLMAPCQGLPPFAEEARLEIHTFRVREQQENRLLVVADRS
jgi:hypothetical protein